MHVHVPYILFPFSPQQFHERCDVPVPVLSKLHLCRYLEVHAGISVVLMAVYMYLLAGSVDSGALFFDVHAFKIFGTYSYRVYSLHAVHMYSIYITIVFMAPGCFDYFQLLMLA